MEKTIFFKLNGESTQMTVEEDRMLLWVLRTELGLTGAKYGCGEGFCGACTVLVNNEPVRSCQFPMKDVGGKEVLTIEGLAKNGELHLLQSSGMILTAYSLFLKNPQPTRKEIMETLEDHLCRCGAHTRIIDAIQTTAELKSEETR